MVVLEGELMLQSGGLEEREGNHGLNQCGNPSCDGLGGDGAGGLSQGV